MPITLNPLLGNLSTAVMVGLAGVVADNIRTGIDSVFHEDIRPTLNWGEDHEITHEITDENGNVIDTVTIYVPHMRDRPENTANLAENVIPGIFEANRATIFSSLSTGVSAAVRSLGNSLLAFGGRFIP